MAGEQGKMVGDVGGRIVLTPLADTWNRVKELDPSLVKLIDVLSR
jgi:hypothetical protein